MSKKFTAEEVAKHSSPDDLWIVINDSVFDLTKFQKIHPGGKKILSKVAGTDATKQFQKYHNANKVLKKYAPKLKIGEIGENSSSASSQIEANPSSQPPSASSSSSTEDVSKQTQFEQFGDMIPYCDPNWYQGHHSEYYNETHVALRAEVREWVEEYLEPNIEEWEEAKEIPNEIYKEMGARGYLSGALGVSYPTKYTDIRPKIVPADKWDPFHEFIVTDEISRVGSGGLIWSLLGGYGIGVPPIYKFAQEEVKQRVLPEILSGDKRCCLCITEPDAGSDVANITTTAVKTPDGKHFIVNGEKKWITNGIWADYFTVALRTGGPGMGGISVLLLERTMPGIETRRMNCQGMAASGTTYVTFEDVKVPVENLIGKENQGFKVIMSNFNHERLGIVIQALRFSRVCLEESVKYAHKRKTFGKYLIEHDVIRNKIAQMSIRVEAADHWLENILFQTKKMPQAEASLRLGGHIAAAKAFSTQAFEYCAREASQIFGGLSYSKGGQGGKIERLYREVRAYAIPGGSEEIMLDLSVRQALKVHKHLGSQL